jgi:hypothetical protein
MLLHSNLASYALNLCPIKMYVLIPYEGFGIYAKNEDLLFNGIKYRKV